MGTRANILVLTAVGLFARIYTHWDGYISHHGPILLDHYNSQERAESLVAGGDISILDFNNDGAAGHSFETRTPGQTIYYGRDRGETGVEPQTFEKIEDAFDDLQEYLYYFGPLPGGANDPQWYVIPIEYGVTPSVADFQPLEKAVPIAVAEEEAYRASQRA